MFKSPNNVALVLKLHLHRTPKKTPLYHRDANEPGNPQHVSYICIQLCCALLLVIYLPNLFRVVFFRQCLTIMWLESPTVASCATNGRFHLIACVFVTGNGFALNRQQCLPIIQYGEDSPCIWWMRVWGVGVGVALMKRFETHHWSPKLLIPVGYVNRYKSLTAVTIDSTFSRTRCH